MVKDVTILISEDDRGHFILMKHCLRDAGIDNEIVWLCDGQETLDFLFSHDGRLNLPSAEKYILLLDIRMPKIDGIEILADIKKDERLDHLPVVIVTSSDNPDNIRRCQDLGCDGYIVKPLDEEAIAMIERLAAAA